jgi:hypothetical protein
MKIDLSDAMLYAGLVLLGVGVQWVWGWPGLVLYLGVTFVVLGAVVGATAAKPKPKRRN